MTLRELELELAWLTKKVAVDEYDLERAELYFDRNRHKWSKGVTAYYLEALEEMKDQLYFEQHRLEKLAWQIIMERDALDT
jgi:hypothetical protein